MTSYMHNNAPIMAKMNDITDTINRISSRYQQMQNYEAHKDKLEMSTLITFAEWTVSPNAHSVHHLMDRLHLTLLGSEDRANATSNNLLAQLATAYEVIQKSFNGSKLYLNQRLGSDFLVKRKGLTIDP